MKLPPELPKPKPPPLPRVLRTPGPPCLPGRGRWRIISAAACVVVAVLVGSAIFKPPGPVSTAQIGPPTKSVADRTGRSGKSKPRTPQEESAVLIDDVDKNVARLIEDHLAEVRRAQGVTNPLRASTVDFERFREAITQELGRILGKDLVLRTQVGAFHQSGGVVKVALVGDLTQFNNDLPTQSKTLRFRLNPEHCIEWTLRPGIQQELARMHFMERMLLEPLTPLIVTIGNRISTASLVGTIGGELDAEFFRQLEVGSFYDCRVRVTRWELLWSWEDEEERNVALSWELFGDTRDADFRAYQRPYVKLTCAWVQD